MSCGFSAEPDFEEELAWMRGFVRGEIFRLEVLDPDDATVMRIIRDLQTEFPTAAWANL
jgi:acyl-CoA dehydrogenase